MSVIISNLSAAVTAPRLVEIFKRFGDIYAVHPVQDSKCAVYKHSQSLNDMMYETAGSNSKYQTVNRKTVCMPYMKNKAMEKYGTVDQYYYPKWKVLYKNFTDAQKAVESMHGRVLDGQRIEVTYDSETAYSNAILLEAMVGRMYNYEVIPPAVFKWKGIDYMFIAYDKVAQIVINKYYIEPAFQVWAGPPDTVNQIITLEDSRQQRYLVRARLDQASQEILPPV